jgi:serine/threonine protein kinase
VGFKRIFENERFIMIEMEYVRGGQLKRLYKERSSHLTEAECAKVMKSLLEGVLYIHSLDIIHRDLKPENILLETSSENCFDVKIVDFGLSAVFHIDRSKNDYYKAGTVSYMSPEQAIKQSYSKKIDIWACGIVMYQLLSRGKHPWYCKGEYKTDQAINKLNAIERGEVTWEFSDSWSPMARDFFQKMCSYPQSVRYNAEQALQHPWITRDFSQTIPKAFNQQIDLIDKEHRLRFAIKSIFFQSVLIQTQKQ